MPRRSARNRKARSDKDYVNPETIPDEAFMTEIQETPLKIYSDDEFDSNNNEDTTFQRPSDEDDEGGIRDRTLNRRRGTNPTRVSTRKRKTRHDTTKETMQSDDPDELKPHVPGDIETHANAIGNKDSDQIPVNSSDASDANAHHSDIPAKTRKRTLEDFIRDHAEEEEEEEENGGMLSSLIEAAEQQPEVVPGFNRGRVAAMEALRLNQAMMDQAETQIQQIDSMLSALLEQKRDLRALSLEEAKLGKKRSEQFKVYKGKLRFFGEEEGEEVPRTFAYSTGENAEDMGNEKSYWSAFERRRLAEGVRAEAQRNLAMQVIANKEAHRVWEIDRVDPSLLEDFPVHQLRWDRISKYYVKKHSPVQCMIQWTTQEHPSINKKPWNKEETDKLNELVDRYGDKGHWQQIAIELNTSRTVQQCFSRYQFLKHNRDIKQRKWTAEEDRMLHEAVDLYGDRNWQTVASYIGKRSGQQCLQRWQKSIDPAIRRSRWTEEEDRSLIAAVQVYGVGKWNFVQQHIPGRTDMQCRERYTNFLDPKLDRGPFTEKEEQKLVELVAQFGPKWSLIARHMPSRTDSRIATAWRRLQKKKQEQEKIKETGPAPVDPPPPKQRKKVGRPKGSVKEKKQPKA